MPFYIDASKFFQHEHLFALCQYYYYLCFWANPHLAALANAPATAMQKMKRQIYFITYPVRYLFIELFSLEKVQIVKYNNFRSLNRLKY